VCLRYSFFLLACGCVAVLLQVDAASDAKPRRHAQGSLRIGFTCGCLTCGCFTCGASRALRFLVFGMQPRVVRMRGQRVSCTYMYVTLKVTRSFQIFTDAQSTTQLSCQHGNPRHISLASRYNAQGCMPIDVAGAGSRGEHQDRIWK
jgi:hypothetical protein